MSIEYKELEVEISDCICGEKEVRILESPIDRPRERYQPPAHSQQLDDLLEELDDLIPLGGSPEHRKRRKELAEAIGLHLYRSVFTGKVERTFDNCRVALDTARQRGRDDGLRIRFSFGDLERSHPEVLGQPWQLLCDPKDLSFPGRAPQTPIVVDLEIAKHIAPIEVEPPLRVLAVLASPKSEEVDPVDLNRHREALEAAVRGPGWVQMRYIQNATLEQLYTHLERSKNPFHAVHFMGHGDFREDGEGVLFFENRQGGAHRVTGRELASQLSGFRELRLAVLATCFGARLKRREGQHPFSGVASALVAGGLPAVVAMQFPITERAARRFVKPFYRKLANGVPVDEAVTAGRQLIARSEEDTFEWASPVLFLRARSGKILDFKKGGKEVAPAKTIAIFNMRDHGQEELFDEDEEINLDRFFEGHKIKDPESWNTSVLREIRKIELIPATNPYHLTIAAPISVSFAAGYFAEAKKGLEIQSVTQRGVAGTKPLYYKGRLPKTASDWVEDIEEGREDRDKIPIDGSSPDIAVAVGLSRPVLPALQYYLNQKDAPTIGHLIDVTPEGGPNQEAVRNGKHARVLADRLSNIIQGVSDRDPGGAVHLFIAAPNVFVFALGTQSRVFPLLQLYEFNMGQRSSGGGSYEPSITLTSTGSAGGR